ncbi:hypothetical protein SRB5_26560 [Streptomyces sp. RB5]|uniref:NAD-dependent epimerase/dehydratase domain-containing protein n=1 Tax=Streptomyces smaragdinus TaxID=2585196 RepID=A0A7K0CGC1_9ACTN|nr:NAD(P)-dependent oxidoreductase [Streptomyces smaragdinus]MQY12521.1 hypothetical protein [Streptomyces smaragdinus]
MNILVTGATGKVGSRFVPRLLQWTAPDDHVRVLVRDAARAAALAGAGAEVVTGDLRSADDRSTALTGVDTVVHVAAAFRGVPDEVAWAVNRDATLALARDAAGEGVGRFVFASTNNVYGAGRGRPAVESDGYEPGGMFDGAAYPLSKLEAEQALLEMHARQELDVRIARLSFVYGDGDDHLAAVLGWAKTWPAHKRLQLVHHADVAQGLWRTLTSPQASGRIYNITDDAPVTTWELYEVLGAGTPPTGSDEPVTDPWEGVASNRRARAELGYRPLYPTMWTARDAGAL